MSLHIQYGPIKVTLEKNAEGYSFACPLCHNMFFTHGDNDCCEKLTNEHMQQFHKITLPASEISITEDQTVAPKVQIQKAG